MTQSVFKTVAARYETISTQMFNNPYRYQGGKNNTFIHAMVGKESPGIRKAFKSACFPPRPFKKWTGYPALSLWISRFFFLESQEYLAGDIFAKAGIPVRFVGEYGRDDIPYRIMDCRVAKRNETKFLQCLKQLEKLLLLRGCTDYPDVCRKFVAMEEESG